MLRIGEQMGRDKEEDWRKAKRSDTRRHRHPAAPGVAGGPLRSKHQRLARVMAHRRSPEKWARCLAFALTLGICAPVAGLAQTAPAPQLITTNLKHLMHTPVTSISRQDQTH